VAVGPATAQVFVGDSAAIQIQVLVILIEVAGRVATPATAVFVIFSEYAPLCANSVVGVIAAMGA